MTTENEKLRALLAEARGRLPTGCHCNSWLCCDYGLPELKERIDAALAEPVKPEYTFRGGYIEDANGDRWWSAELLAKTERERDEARAEVERLRWHNEAGCENTPTRGCECPGCGLARERADRGEVGP